MTKAQFTNPSLWWRLSWQLSVVFVAVVAAVIFGLCVYGATILSPNVALEDHVTAVLARSVALDAQGQLEIRDTPELASLKEQYDGLWYVAATTNGSSVSYGAIPAAYSELAHLTHLYQGADIRGSVGTNEIASVENVETAIGELRVLFGGVADKGWPVLVLMGAVYPIYVSLLTVALLKRFFLPFRELSGVPWPVSARLPARHRRSNLAVTMHACLWTASPRRWPRW